MTKYNDDKPMSNWYNLHDVDSMLMRSGHIPAHHLQYTCKQHNISTVISLETHDDVIMSAEEKACKDVKVKWYNFPINQIFVNQFPKQQIIDALYIISTSPKSLIHCYRGSDRTGLVCAAYRFKYNNWDVNTAISEMYKLGFNKILYKLWAEELKDWLLSEELKDDMLQLK